MTAKRDINDAKHTIARWKNLSSTFKNENETIKMSRDIYKSIQNERMHE